MGSLAFSSVPDTASRNGASHGNQIGLLGRHCSGEWASAPIGGQGGGAGAENALRGAAGCGAGARTGGSGQVNLCVRVCSFLPLDVPRWVLRGDCLSGSGVHGV